MSNPPAFPAPAAPFVELQSVSFGYSTRAILDRVSMRFVRGQVTAVMGGSGVGKTTVLRLVAGQVPPTAGRVQVDGDDIASLDTAGLYRMRRKLGMLFQFGALFTDMTVFDNVAFPLREHTRLPEPVIRDVVLMKLQAVGLRGAADLRPSEISGGMSRRVALARAIALDPPLVLFDEPFAGLDPISLGITAQLIRTLTDALGCASVLVTHDVHESFAIADQVYVLAPGEQGAVVAAEGTPQTLSASTDPYVRQFLSGAAEGPVRFHYPAPDLAADFGLVSGVER